MTTTRQIKEADRLQAEIVQKFNLSKYEQMMLDDIIAQLLCNERENLRVWNVVSKSGVDGISILSANIQHRNGVIKYHIKPCVMTYAKGGLISEEAIPYENFDLALMEILKYL